MSFDRTQKKRPTNDSVEREDKRLYNYATPEELEEARKLEAEPTSPKAWNAIIDAEIRRAL